MKNVSFSKHHSFTILYIIIGMFISFQINSQDLVQENDFEYIGAFKVPLGEQGNSSFSYGGTAPVYNPNNHSLFMVGHTWDRMVAENNRSVLFFGRHGTGTFCYGLGEDCNDPVYPSQGTHAYPYVYQVWAYDVLDLLDVKNGTKQPWEALPYATWELGLPFAGDDKEIGGVAYNSATNQIYISQLKAEDLSQYPVVHVFELTPQDGSENNGDTSCDCESLAAPTNTTVTVSTVPELQTALQQANTNNGDMTILLEDGMYELTSDLLYIGTNMVNLTIRSASGNRDAVTIRGQGMDGNVTYIFNVAASNFTAADMTLGWVHYHAIQIHGEHNADDCLIQNIRFVDVNEQMLKVSGSTSENKSDNGLVQCCLFEFTAGIANQWYTGGIDAHQAQNWEVRHNTFKGIRSPEANLAEHAIHFWSGAAGTLVENNTIINCDRGIGFGLGNSSHIDGVIRNNMVHTNRDVGIGLETSTNTQVYHNTVITDNYFNSIEYRFVETTNVHIANNLTTEAIASRNGGTGTIESNYQTNDRSIFVDDSNYDFHLSSTLTDITDAAINLPTISIDYDCDIRPDGNSRDIGADELNMVLAVTDVTFQAAYESNTVVLDWIKNSNTELHFFDIQRSIDGINFQDIGHINSEINKHRYAFQDDNLPKNQSVLYYRLKYSDEQGESEFSKVLTVAIPKQTTVTIQFIPNPVQNILQVHLNHFSDAKADCQIFNSSGQLVLQQVKTVGFQNNETSFSLHVGFLAKGLYSIHIKDKENVIVERFVKY